MSPALSPRNVLGLLGAFVATSAVAGLLAAGLAMPAIGASGLATKNSVNFFDSLPGDLAQPPLSEKSTLLASDGSVITTFYDENRDNVDLADISLNMQRAIVAIEDARFYQHGGVDPKGLVRAFVVNQISGNVEQGASTLTQQYVKNVLKESAYVKGDEAELEAAQEKTNGRKLKEIRYAVTLEKTMSKDEILNRYLNIAWFGGKINGVQAAAKYYFNTTAKKLTLPQAATLAGMIQSPVDLYSPKNNPAASLSRRNVVLGKMLELKMIDQPTHDAAVMTKLGAKITPTRQGCANAGNNGYFCDYVYNLMLKNKAFSSLGATQEDRANKLLRGGLTIKTTLSPKIEKAAWLATSKTIPPKDKSGVATATVTIQPGTGKVLSIAQDKVYTPGNKRGQTTINYSVDSEYGGSAGFQTGSTFKAFTLATWLKAGKSLNSTVNAAAGSAPFSDFTACGKKVRGGVYNYGNAADGEGSGGPMSVWSATAASVNGAFVSMEKQLDLCDIRETAEQLGVHLARSQPDGCSLKRPQPMTKRLPTCYPSLTLGVVNISPMTMAAAYATFAAQGMYCAPTAITSIKDGNGKALKVPGANCKQTLDQDVANTVNLGLSKVFSRGGTAARVGGLPGGRPASGKTGTTNKSVDAWFVGYTPQLATAVWVGDPDIFHGSQKSMTHITINHRYYPAVYGASIAGPIWKKIMTQASRGMEIQHFDKASSRLLASPKSSVPNVRGKSVSTAFTILKAAGFKPQTGGIAASKYPAGSVASTSPDGGSQLSKGSTVTITVSAGGGGGNGGVGPG